MTAARTAQTWKQMKLQNAPLSVELLDSITYIVHTAPGSIYSKYLRAPYWSKIVTPDRIKMKYQEKRRDVSYQFQHWM